MQNPISEKMSFCEHTNINLNKSLHGTSINFSSNEQRAQVATLNQNVFFSNC